MLVLTRKKEESLVIDDNITITILGIEGDKVKIGIEAPRAITILRHELWQAINEQKQIAARLASDPEPEQFIALREFLATEAINNLEAEKEVASDTVLADPLPD